MTHYTADQLASFPWIVSTGTLRLEDLLPKYWQTAEQLAQLADRPALINPGTLAGLQKLVGEDSRESDWNDEEACQLLEDLTDTLQDVAPVGFYFGTSEGDGACFGFWLGEDWAEALETLGLDGDDPAGWAELISRLELDGIDPENVEDAYQGRAEGYSEENAGATYAEELAYETGAADVDWGGQCRWPLGCIDWNAAWRELELGDGYRLHDIGGGEWLVFRAV
jgi:hypothetical protein